MWAVQANSIRTWRGATTTNQYPTFYLNDGAASTELQAREVALDIINRFHAEYENDSYNGVEFSVTVVRV